MFFFCSFFPGGAGVGTNHASSLNVGYNSMSSYGAGAGGYNGMYNQGYGMYPPPGGYAVHPPPGGNVMYPPPGGNAMYPPPGGQMIQSPPERNAMYPQPGMYPPMPMGK